MKIISCLFSFGTILLFPSCESVEPQTTTTVVEETSYHRPAPTTTTIETVPTTTTETQTIRY